jgi:hypothetical protein
VLIRLQKRSGPTVGPLDTAYYPIGPVMDGYSVKDAALVLGIPERRVWELIARGVLASSREGPDGMRVFLQPRVAAQAAVPEPHIYRADEPEPSPRSNGNGGSHEMSPFRELLTEFRSLTERYGQALLALGEARGEVASLRSRVELLEARMDLRLPGTRPASTVAWEIPGYAPGGEPSEPEPEASAEAMPEPEPDVDLPADELEVEQPMVAEADLAPEPAEPSEPSDVAEPSAGRQRRAESRRRKIKGGRSALVGIAEALARAEDPTLAELPGAEEAAEAMAALQADVDAAHGDAEPAASDAASLEPEPIEEEPEVFTDASMAALSVPAEGLVADAEEPWEAEASAEIPDVMEVSFVTAAEDGESELPPEAGGDWAEEADAAEAALNEAALTEEALTEDAIIESAPVEPAPQPAAEAHQVTAPTAPEPALPEGTHELLSAPDSPYSADVVEPDWFADGDFTWLEASQAEAAAPENAPAAEPEPRIEAPSAVEPASAAEPASAIEPDVDAFEPSAHDEFRAEEEARAAIQEAFQEAAAPDAATQASVAFEEPAAEPVEEAVQEAFAAPAGIPDAEAEAEPQAETSAEMVEEAIQDAFAERAGPAPAPQPEATAEPEAAPEEFVAEPPEMTSAAPATTVEAPAAPSGEEELMWLGDEFEEASIEVAAQGWRSADAPAAPAHESPSREAPPLELSDAELSQLAEDEGWDSGEVEAIRRLLGRPIPPAASPGAASDVIPGAEEPPGPEAPTQGLAMLADDATFVQPRPERRHAMSSMSDPQWLRGRRGPAATAYRRLRRLFPG